MDDRPVTLARQVLYQLGQKLRLNSNRTQVYEFHDFPPLSHRTHARPVGCAVLLIVLLSGCVDIPATSDDADDDASTPISTPPAALSVSAGEDISAEERTLIQLNGSAEGGEALSYAWHQLSGPTITLSDSNSASLSFEAPSVTADTTLMFALSANDGAATSARDEINVTILAVNDPPSVEAGPDLAVGEGALVTFLGAAQDEDSDDLTYLWTQVSGLSVTLDDVDSPSLQFQTPVMSTFKLGSPAHYATDNRSISTEMADLNGDQILDLAVSNFRANTVSVLLGKGDGSFHEAVGDSPYSVKAGDLNHDNHLDLVTANASSDDVTVLINNGDGTFATGVHYAVGDGPWYADIGDLNGDGHPDLAAGNEWDDTASVLLGHGDGSFNVPSAYYTVGLAPRSLQKGDLNGDDEVDLVIANEDSHTVSVLLSNGDGTFHTAVDYAVGDSPRWATIGDLNGDTLPDLAVANRQSDDISVLLGNGDGTFKPALHYDVRATPGVDPIKPYGIAIGDLNGDGKNDLATADYRSYTTTVLLNESSIAAPTTLVFRLTVTDEQGASRSDDVAVDVSLAH